MITTHTIAETNTADAELVARSLEGDRDAFGCVVARYQTLVCSLAYSICGDIQFSEELAQETFIAAWRQLRNLHEPEKLKSWLCGIVRNLAHNAVRRQQRVPTASAESLDDGSLMSSTSPHDDAISREEAAMLWTALEDLPANYREPMILFYREQESVRAVAEALDISEDTAKQRLARGRVMLTEHIERALRAALRDTVPGAAFTLAVLATLPFAATSAKAATIAAATKYGATKTAASAGGALAMLASIIGLGGYVGFKMRRDAEEPGQRREWVTDFWRALVAGMLLFVAPALCMASFWHRSQSWLHMAGTWWLGIFYAVVLACLAIWMWRRRSPAVEMTGKRAHGIFRQPLAVWVVLAMIGMAGLFALAFSDSIRARAVTPAELQQLAGTRPDATFEIFAYGNGSKVLYIHLPEMARRAAFEVQVDEATLAILKENQIICPTYIQGRDFEVLGTPGRLIGFVAIFVLSAGTVILVKRNQARRAGM